MFRHAFLTLVAVTAMTGSARAGVILSMEDTPTLYTPGATFSFNIRLQNAVDLNSFTVGLRLTAADDNADAETDFYFSGASTSSLSTGYVFDASANGTSGFTSLVTSEPSMATSHSIISKITVEDMLLLGGVVSTAVTGKELIATIFVTTTRDVGNLTVSFNASSIKLKNAGGGLIADEPGPGVPPLPDGVDELILPSESLTIQPVPPSDSSSVPEPASAVIWCLMGLGFAGAVRTRQRRSASGR